MPFQWLFSSDAFRRSQEILEETVTKLVQTEQLPLLPPVLYHYTSLETMGYILQGDDIRLSHAEYSNDQHELGEAKRVIEACLAAHSGTPTFLRQVKTAYDTRAADVDAYKLKGQYGGIAPAGKARRAATTCGSRARGRRRRGAHNNAMLRNPNSC